MPGTLRWGILGPGGIAESQTTDLLGAGFTVTAVGSRSTERAQEFADRFGIANVHGSYEELVADPEVDIVYVATPHSTHYRHARLALEAGKHVLVEKSFTVTAEQAQILVDMADAAQLVILEAMWTRFLPHMVRVREIIEAGTIGEVRTLLADHNQKLPHDPHNRLYNPELAGGALLDLGIYVVSLAWDIFGEPETITAHGSFTDTGVDRQTAVIFGYSGGRQAVLHTALDTAGPNRAFILGTKGWIGIDPSWSQPTSFTVYDTDGTVLEQFQQAVENRGMQFQAAEVERLIESGNAGSDILPPSESVAIMRGMDEIRKQIGLDYPASILEV